MTRPRGALALMWDRPARVLLASFAATILLGTALLMLPFATRGPGSLGALDSLFTATSAVCVTGLAVVDTGSTFTGFGQVVILILIQIGALGIMAFAISTVLLVRRRLTMDEAELLSYMLNEGNMAALRRRLGVMFAATMSIESVGAVVLSLGFVLRGIAWQRSLWLGVFHSVSAFANAGFSLFPDSLAGFADSPIILVPIMGLIVLGGIGFGVVAFAGERASRDVRNQEDPGSDGMGSATELRYRPTLSALRLVRWTARSQQEIAFRLAVRLSLLLIIVGAVGYYVAEARHALIGQTIGQKYLSALFQSVTLRTAGFESVAFGSLRRTTLLLVIPLMFIGGAAGGTAGGIKLGTFAVLFAEVRRFFLRQNDARLFARRIPGRLITQAVVLTGAGLVAIGIGVVVLASIEPVPLEAILFEVVSAVGTVGLSTGITGDISTVGRVVLIGLMFLGRLGPLTFFAALGPDRAAAEMGYPDANIPIG